MQSLCLFWEALGQSCKGWLFLTLQRLSDNSFSCYSLALTPCEEKQEVQMCRSQQIHIYIKFSLEENFRTQKSEVPSPSSAQVFLLIKSLHSWNAIWEKTTSFRTSSREVTKFWRISTSQTAICYASSTQWIRLLIFFGKNFKFHAFTN